MQLRRHARGSKRREKAIPFGAGGTSGSSAAKAINTGGVPGVTFFSQE